MRLPLRKTKAQEPAKTCPFLDRDCLRSGCQIYNEKLSRCEIGLTAYNLFLLADALNRQVEDVNQTAG